MKTITKKIKKGEFTNLNLEETDYYILTGARGVGKSFPVAKYVKKRLMNNPSSKFAYFRISKDELSTFSGWCEDLDGLEIALKENNEYVRYGGRTYNARGYNTYEPVTGFIDGNTNVQVYGDYYVTLFDYLRAPANPNEADTLQNIVVFPTLSRYNLTMRMDKSVTKFSRIGSRECLYLGEKKHNFEKNNKIYTQDYDLYTYNNIYSKSNSIERELPMPFDFEDQKEFKTRVYHSKHKINGEYGDSWIEFYPNKQLDLESKYGKLVKLVKFKERVYYFQENCFGTLFINERQSAQSQDGVSIIVAKSDVLDGYKELDDTSGIQNTKHHVNSSKFIYWWDHNKKQFNRFSGNRSEDLGMLKGMASWFESIQDSDSVLLGFNGDLNEVHIYKNDEILIFSEDMNMFTSLIDSKSGISHYLTSLNNNMYSVDGNELYIHDQGNKCQIYGTYKNPSLTLIVSPLQGEVFTLDVLELLIDYIDNSGDYLHRQNPIQSIRVSNNYQDTGDINVSNFKQRFRKWRLNNIRDDGSESNRMNDYYAKIKITFNTGDNNRILLHKIISYFRKHIP